MTVHGVFLGRDVQIDYIKIPRRVLRSSCFSAWQRRPIEDVQKWPRKFREEACSFFDYSLSLYSPKTKKQ